LREKCPKTGKVIDKPSECAGCEFLMVTIPAGWACTYHSEQRSKEPVCKPIEHIEQYFKRQDEFLKRTLKKKETSEKREGE